MRSVPDDEDAVPLAAPTSPGVVRAGRMRPGGLGRLGVAAVSAVAVVGLVLWRTEESSTPPPKGPVAVATSKYTLPTARRDVTLTASCDEALEGGATPRRSFERQALTPDHFVAFAEHCFG